MNKKHELRIYYELTQNDEHQKKKFLCHYLDNFEMYGFHNLFLKNLNNSITSAMNFFALQKSSQFSFL